MLSSLQCWPRTGMHALVQLLLSWLKHLRFEGNIRGIFLTSLLRKHCRFRLWPKSHGSSPAWAILEDSILARAGAISGFTPQNRNEGCGPSRATACHASKPVGMTMISRHPTENTYVSTLNATANNAITPVQGLLSIAKHTIAGMTGREQNCTKTALQRAQHS